MQIVIDIPEEIYDYIHNDYMAVRCRDAHKIAEAIFYGVPLPKGHGRIIDIGPYEGKVIASRKYHDVNKLIEVAELDTIIEADEESDTEEHSCSKCGHLGWENVGEGMNPVCEQELYMDVDKEISRSIGLYKSEPTIEDKNDCCYWMAKEVKE